MSNARCAVLTCQNDSVPLDLKKVLQISLAVSSLIKLSTQPPNVDFTEFFDSHHFQEHNRDLVSVHVPAPQADVPRGEGPPPWPGP